LVIHGPEAKWVKWIFEQRADGRGWASMSRELTERGVRQGTGRKLTHHMLRRMVTHRVYLGVAYHGKHVHPDAHPALIDPVLFEAANRVLPGAPPPRSGRVNVIGGLPRCAGCSYVLKPLITRAGDYRWLCRTLLAEQSATYECAAPARIRSSEHDALRRLVVDAAKKFAASVGVETADDQRFEAAQRARVEAERVLDDVSTLDMRRTLGPERWDKLVREASASLEAAKIQETRAQTHKKVNRRVWLSDSFDGLPPEQQRAELRTLVRCVMVEAGEGPLADRVHVLPADNPVELPRQGVPSVARRWTPQDRSPVPAEAAL
jgi:hypothetical protein